MHEPTFPMILRQASSDPTLSEVSGAASHDRERRWQLEKIQCQNPRIRALLGCIHVLEEVAASDAHILHCSPTSLLRMWDRVLELRDLLRLRLPGALEGRSSYPELEQARRDAEDALAMLDATLLADFDRFPRRPPEDLLPALRRLLCSSLGQLKVFLHETFSRIVAADPRSSRDVEHYLARCSAGDAEESAWLYESVCELAAQLELLEEDRRLLDVARRHGPVPPAALPDVHGQQRLTSFLQRLHRELPELLSGLRALHGVRCEERATLDRYVVEIPAQCLRVLEVQKLLDEVVGTFEAAGRGDEDEVRRGCQAVLSGRLASLVAELDRTLCDLIAFAPLWRHNLEHRWALAVREEPEVRAAS